tara:strand:+ start:13915 stop:14208 length:294 start_codon:yes stop_codon:yes gene_type:complete
LPDRRLYAVAHHGNEKQGRGQKANGSAQIVMSEEKAVEICQGGQNKEDNVGPHRAADMADGCLRHAKDEQGVHAHENKTPEKEHQAGNVSLYETEID